MASREVVELPTTTPFTELGVPVSRSVAEHIYEDFLPQLRGRKALETYREMGDNDATIGSILYGIEMLVRGVAWSTQPASEDSVDLAAGQFLDENVAGLQHPFRNTIAEMLSAGQFGFSFHETVYERVEDGTVRWRKFGNRPQESLLKWVLDEYNEPVGFVQAVDRTNPVTIPLAKGVHFRIHTSKPSGKSLLRTLYRTWFFKKRNEEKLQIGIDRNLNGIPKADVPAEILVAGEGDARYDMIKKIVTRTRKDEQSGIMWPLEYDANGNELYKFSLLSPDGNPRFDQIVGVIRMQAADMAGALLAQFISLGRDAVGSRALAEPMQDLFQAALEAILDGMQDTLNRQAVKPLFELNPGIVPDGRPLPKLVHGEIRDVDLEQLGNFILRTAQGGAVWPFDQGLTDKLVELAGFETDQLTDTTTTGNER
jgi:hypothetical protein